MRLFLPPFHQHWRHDFISGLHVSLVSLPLSMGIAIASGAPPIAGILSSITAGMIMPFVGGSFVTISGPAAGLAPILASGIMILGEGDPLLGYHRLLVVIFFAGAIQLLLSKLKFGRLFLHIPHTIVDAMLGAIGINIIITQLPVLFGASSNTALSAKSILLSFPHYLIHGNVVASVIGIISLIFILSAHKTRKNMLKSILHPYFVVILFGICMSQIGELSAAFLVQLPQSSSQFLSFPAFADILKYPNLIMTMVGLATALILIDTTESILTIRAIDKIDPFKRSSNANRTLYAMGICNITSSLVGGLTIIPGGVKSKINISSGGRTLWANFYNALWLLIFIMFGTSLIELIPLTSLAALLIAAGLGLLSTSIRKEEYRLRYENRMIFVVVVTSSILWDLLTGIVAGCVIHYVFLLWTQYYQTKISGSSQK